MRSSVVRTLHVVGGHVAQQRDQHVVVVLDRGVQAGVGRLDGPAERAPEVEFPRETEALVPLTVVALDAESVGAVGNFSTEGFALVAGLRGLRLRQQIADGLAAQRPRLQHAPAGLSATSGVLLIAQANELVEHGIVEDRPPFAQVVGILAHPRIVGVDPVAGDRRSRLGVLRADFEAVLDVVPERAVQPPAAAIMHTTRAIAAAQW